MTTKNITTICLDFCKEGDRQLSITTNSKSITVDELKNQVMKMFAICDPKLVENPTSVEITMYNDFVKLWNNEWKEESSEFLMKSFDCPKAFAQTVKELNATRDKLQNTENKLQNTENKLQITADKLKSAEKSLKETKLTLKENSLLISLMAKKLNIDLEELKNEI